MRSNSAKKQCLNIRRELLILAHIPICLRGLEFILRWQAKGSHPTETGWSNCWIPCHSVPPLFSLVGVLWRTKQNTIDAILIQWHTNKWQGILQLSPLLNVVDCVAGWFISRGQRHRKILVLLCESKKNREGFDLILIGQLCTNQSQWSSAHASDPKMTTN